MELERTKWGNKSKEELQALLDSSCSYKEVAAKLGYFSNRGSYSDCITKMIRYHQLDTTKIDENRKKYLSETSHVKLIQYYNHEKLSGQDLENEINKRFTENSTYARKNIRNFILRYNLISYECALCGNTGIWKDKEIILELDHINGIYNDHRLSNLRWLCPNCHATTETHRGKNIVFQRQQARKTNTFCIMCNTEISKGSTYCRNCYNIKKREKIPPREVLKQEIRQGNFLSLSRKYHVSDNAIRKWCKSYNLPSQSLEIKKYSDEDWEKI